MKVIYCIAGLRHSGGMERVLTNKANYLVELGVQVLVVTTDQYGENNFFALSPKVRTVDLGINYEENNGKSFWNKLVQYPFKLYAHKKKLFKLLQQEKPDIVISMFCNDVSFLWKIKDGSKKVLEIHFSRYKRLQYGRTGIWRLADKLRSWMDLRTVSRYDRFVVLTKEDAGYWGNLPNIEVIANARTFSPESSAPLYNKRVIAAGRYDYQKGFEDLIAAWAIVAKMHPNWKLDIFGNGQLEKTLNNQINKAGLRECVSLKPPVPHIGEELLQSSIFAMSSRYEGLPMVLLEAQAYGLPVVSYACKCGPRDVITHGVDGFLVPEGNIPELANKLIQLIEDPDRRKQMGNSAKENSNQFSEEKIMKQWLDLFGELYKE